MLLNIGLNFCGHCGCTLYDSNVNSYTSIYSAGYFEQLAQTNLQSGDNKPFQHSRPGGVLPWLVRLLLSCETGKSRHINLLKMFLMNVVVYNETLEGVAAG